MYPNLGKDGGFYSDKVNSIDFLRSTTIPEGIRYALNVTEEYLENWATEVRFPLTLKHNLFIEMVSSAGSRVPRRRPFSSLHEHFVTMVGCFATLQELTLLYKAHSCSHSEPTI